MTDATRHHQFLWFDCETTGINPQEDSMLEWALALVADDALGDMSIVEEFGSVVHYDRQGGVDDYVERTHTANGLWAECAADQTTLAECDQFLAELAKSLGGNSKNKLRLAGNSVHFDLAFCRVHLPLFSEYLSHRVLNVSSFRDAAAAWGVELPPAPVPSRHRALDDVRATVALAKVCRDAMGWWPRLVKRVNPDLLPAEYWRQSRLACVGVNDPHPAWEPDLARIEAAGAAATDTLPIIPGVVWR